MICSKEIVTKIKVSDICGTHTLTRADGKLLNNLIVGHWAKSNVIEIDFSNAIVASVSFLDEAIGQLVARFSRKDISAKLKLARISQFDKKLLNDIVSARSRQTIRGRKGPK